jgi:hypothetical protein
MLQNCRFCPPGSVFRIRITTTRIRTRMSVPTYVYCGINLANKAKNDLYLKSAGTLWECDLLKAKA